MHVSKNKRMDVHVCKSEWARRPMDVCLCTVVHVPKISILSQYIFNILAISSCIWTTLDNIASNIMPTMRCSYVANSATIMSIKILSFHCQHFQCKASI